MFLKQDIGLISMDRILLFKILLLTIYAFVSFFFFYDKHFPTNSEPIYHFEALPFMAATVSFGVIISASVYNLALYAYLRYIQHLLYAAAQLATLFFLITLDSLFIDPFQTIFGIRSWILFDLSQLLMFVFSILFLKVFVQSYVTKRVCKIIDTLVYLSLADLMILFIFGTTIILKFVPSFILIFFVLTEVFRDAQYKDLPLYLITIGWSIVIVTVTLEYLGLLAILGVEFPFLHIAIALESIILSVAVAYKFKLLEREKEEQRNLLMQQSRMASLGEMMSSIAHQWRQPLNVISFGLMNIKKRSKEDEKSLHVIQRLNEQVQYMSDTMEDFRNFYNPSKTKTMFDVRSACEKAKIISAPILEKNRIGLDINIEKNFTLYGRQNELEQVILSIITNAKDVSLTRKIKEPHISIVINKPTLTISDTMGGIPETIRQKIFESHFSTKENGDGIGLYLSKMIIEKELGGKISVKNHNKGSTFVIMFEVYKPLSF